MNDEASSNESLTDIARQLAQLAETLRDLSAQPLSLTTDGADLQLLDKVAEPEPSEDQIKPKKVASSKRPKRKRAPRKKKPDGIMARHGASEVKEA